MAVFTLTTDWHNSDYYIGAVKGKIISQDVTSVIIDINHQISTYNTMQAAFVLRNCYREFPEKTIHIIGVNSVLSVKRPLLIVEKDKQFFLCSDTGFPDLIFPNQEFKVYKYAAEKGEGDTFGSLDTFVNVGNQLAKGVKPADLGELTTEYLHQVPLRPTIENNLINGSVAYIDSFSNVITNISRETFERVGEGNAFEIFVQSNHYVIKTICNSYLDSPVGELLALFNSSNLLEIAIANGPVAELLNLDVNSTIRVKFKNSKPENQLLLSGE